MSLLGAILLIALLGFIVWLAVTFIPMPPAFKTLIVVLAVAAVVLWLLTAWHLVPNLAAIRIGR